LFHLRRRVAPISARAAAALSCAAFVTVASSGQVSAATRTAGIRPSSSSAQDNLTYHQSNLRLGWNSAEKVLTTANVASSAFHLIGTMPIAGKSFSQPLYVSNQVVAGGSTHNLLIVTDSTDVVYAYDADSLTLVWKRDFKSQNTRQEEASDTNCDDDWPNDGINGTPVVDRTRNVAYVVVPLVNTATGTFELTFHAISLANGKDATKPADIRDAGAVIGGREARVSPKFNFDRAGLLEVGNTVYVPLSTHCDDDSNAAHGWLIAYDADTLKPTGGLVDTTAKNDGDSGGAQYLGSVWQGGFGVAADATGDIYFATGNGPADGKSDFAMSVLRLTPDLNPANTTFFTPSTWQGDSQSDQDLGSGGVMLLPDQTSGPYKHLAIAGGKTGQKYLLDRDALGGLHNPDQIPFEANLAGGQFGGPAYFVDSSGNQHILYGGSPNLEDFRLATSPYGLTFVSQTNVGSLENDLSGVTPVVSSNGTRAGTAVVWTIQTPLGGLDGSAPISLYAFDGANLGHTLYSSSQAGLWTGNGNTGGALITPLVANGRVYLATDGMVSAFGIQ
jgi:hypothetical protein